MKHINALLLVLMISALGCAGQYDSDTETGFVTLDFDTTYTLDADKSYDITGIGTDTGSDVSAIYYAGTYSDSTIIGFGVMAGTEKLLMYSSDGGTTYTVIRTSASYTETVTTTNVSAVSDDLDLKLITFNGTVDFTNLTDIQNGDYIRGAIYP